MKQLLLMCMLLLVGLDAGAQERKSTAGRGVQVLAPMTIPGLERARTIRIYLPPGYEAGQRRYPVLYMHDGQNLFDDATSFVGEWGVDEAMDALATEHGLELIVVGIDNGGEHRISELSAWPNPKYGNKAEGREYMRFVVDVLKPFIDSHYRTRPGREDTALMGSSLGGLISHYAAFEHADTFGKIGIFSPAYWFAAPAVFEFGRGQRLPPRTRMFVLAGSKEGDEPRRVVEDTWTMVAQLRREQPDLQLRAQVRVGGEHNERFWRAEFPAALRFLFGTD